MGVVKGAMQVVDVYPHLPTRSRNCSSKSTGFVVPFSSSTLNLVTESPLAEKHASIENVRPFVVEGKYVLLLDHDERAKVER